MHTHTRPVTLAIPNLSSRSQRLWVPHLSSESKRWFLISFLWSKPALIHLLFSGVSRGPSTTGEPEDEALDAPSPPSDPPGSPEPAGSANPKHRNSKMKSKVEEWIHVAAAVLNYLTSVSSLRSLICSGGHLSLFDRNQATVFVLL